jgi:hypothetical protein
MNKPDYQFYAIPNSVFECRQLSSDSKLLFGLLRGREYYLASKGDCSWGGWFPTTYAALASVLGKSTESIRKKYIPELVAAGLIEKETEQGFDRRQWIPKRTCQFRIKWDYIIKKQ